MPGLIRDPVAVVAPHWCRLSLYSYLAGARSALGTWGWIASGAVGAGIGILVALLKVALH